MPSTLIPTQFGYTPTGVGSTAKTSTLYLGRVVSGGGTDGPGFGAGGRPDYLQKVWVSLTKRENDGSLTQLGSVIIQTSDLVATAAGNPNFPRYLNLTLKEVLVCDNGTTKGMVILGSSPYDLPEA